MFLKKKRSSTKFSFLPLLVIFRLQFDQVVNGLRRNPPRWKECAKKIGFNDHFKKDK